MAPVVAVDEVHGAPARRRFVELPHVLDGSDPRFAPLVLAWERFRIDRHRNPALEGAEWTLLLARRAGRPVGRISARLAEGSDEGQLGHWWVDDDPATADALLDAAATWSAERGARSMTGPVTFAPEQEAGVLIEGFDVPGLTGRPWHPPRLAEALARAGFAPAEQIPTWRLTVPTASGDAQPPGRRRLTAALDPAGPYADPRLVFPGIRAVPDVADVVRSARGRGSLAAARRARSGDWSTAVVVGPVEDPERAVPALLDAASAAGYRWLVAPWSPDGREPETVHATFTRTL